MNRTSYQTQIRHLQDQASQSILDRRQRCPDSFLLHDVYYPYCALRHWSKLGPFAINHFKIYRLELRHRRPLGSVVFNTPRSVLCIPGQPVIQHIAQYSLMASTIVAV